MTTAERAARTEAVWREFQAHLRAFVLRRTEAPADVDDIVQEVFVRIHGNLDRVHSEDKLPAWIFQITRNAIVDHYRVATKAESIDSDFESPLPPQDDDTELRELEELSRCIEPMLGALPQHYQDALKLTDLDGISQREAARQSRISLSGMKSRVQRARRQLKQIMLECCEIELDRRGGILGHELRQSADSPCGDSSMELKPNSACRTRCRD
jgi:RNA polymerase sigma-70 factor, ECF subfamily